MVGAHGGLAAICRRYSGSDFYQLIQIKQFSRVPFVPASTTKKNHEFRGKPPAMSSFSQRVASMPETDHWLLLMLGTNCSIQAKVPQEVRQSRSLSAVSNSSFAVRMLKLNELRRSLYETEKRTHTAYNFAISNKMHEKFQ